jgi:hypothetical protein
MSPTVLKDNIIFYQLYKIPMGKLFLSLHHFFGYTKCNLVRQNVSSFDIEEGRGFGDTAKNPNCKYVLLRPAKTSAVFLPGTSNKVNDLQDLDPTGPAVWQ